MRAYKADDWMGDIDAGEIRVIIENVLVYLDALVVAEQERNRANETRDQKMEEALSKLTSFLAVQTGILPPMDPEAPDA